jgi:hypothetical protein
MRPVDRIVAGFLLVLLAAGSLWLWIGMPALSLWAVAQVTESPSRHLVLGLLSVPAGMILFAPLLFWVNGLYLRVTGAHRRVEDEEGGELLRVRGPLEPILVWSFAIAVVALAVWLVAGSGNVQPAGPFL